jgi:HSP20 family molecular chaperone IbpA
MLPSVLRRNCRRNRGLSSSLWNDGDSIFDSFFRDFESVFGDSYVVDRENGTLTYEFEVPGFNKDNLKVEVADGLLTIQGERDIAENRAGQRSVSKQLSVGNVENVDAVLQDGILTLKLSYPTAKTTPVQITDGNKEEV